MWYLVVLGTNLRRLFVVNSLMAVDDVLFFNVYPVSSDDGLFLIILLDTPSDERNDDDVGEVV